MTEPSFGLQERFNAADVEFIQDFREDISKAPDWVAPSPFDGKRDHVAQFEGVL
ncbi:MAG: hypothetical protein ACREER_04800 [Alphaproteobacteria bacterium]